MDPVEATSGTGVMSDGRCRPGPWKLLHPVHGVWEMIDPQYCMQKLGLGSYQNSKGSNKNQLNAKIFRICIISLALLILKTRNKSNMGVAGGSTPHLNI